MGESIPVASCPRFRGTPPERWVFKINQTPLVFQKIQKPSTFLKNRPALLSIAQVPHWLRANEYILTGYRAQTSSVADCIASWSYLHNETANIYTHMIPAFCLVIGEVLLYQHFRSFYPDVTEADQLVFALLLFAALVCMCSSTAYHTFLNHSRSISDLWLRIDYVGIVSLILANILSGTYMLFYCLPNLIWLYWAVTLVLSSLSCIIVLYPKFQSREWRQFRTATFVCMGLSSLAPLTHATLIFGPSEMLKRSGLPYYLLEGVLHFTGVFFYTTRIPESLRPGRFDIWLSSHQIFHVLVVLATVAQVLGVWHAFDYNYTHGLVCDAL